MPVQASTRTLSPVHAPGRLLRRIGGLMALHRSRRALARLDERMLRDIGLTRAEAEAELARPVWNAPLHWRD